MPKILAIYEFCFVRPEDVRHDDMVIDDETPDAYLRSWRTRAQDYAGLAAALREEAAACRLEGRVGRADEADANAAHLADAAPTEERTVCVRRNVK